VDEDKLQSLIDGHPQLFHGRGPEVESYVYPGWYPLLDHLCGEIERLLTQEETKRFKWLQIKQKFGELRLYFRSDRRDEVQKLVSQAEKASQTICQVCGSHGRIRDDKGYFAVRCDKHTPQRAKGY